MKVGYYIQRCKGDININIVSNGELLRYGDAENMNANMDASYSYGTTEGFSDDIWLMEVIDFRIVGNRLDLIV